MKVTKIKDPAREKTKSFRFGGRAQENLNALTEELGLARSDTEAVEFALEHIVTEERTKRAIRKNENAQTWTMTDRCDYMRIPNTISSYMV